MSRNGSGTYTLPAGNPVVTGTTITTTWANNTLSDMATALSGSIAADGQTPITGALVGSSDTVQFGGTGQIALPSGTTAQRSSSPYSGMIRYNNSLAQFEGYSGASWKRIGEDATNLLGGVAGSVPYQSAPNTTLFTVAGTAGQVLTSAGTGTPTWTNPFVAMTLISTQTVSSSTLSVQFTGLTGFNTYVLYFSKVSPSISGNNFFVQVGTGSTTWITSNVSATVQSVNGSNSPAAGGADNAAYGDISGFTYGVQLLNSENANGQLIFNGFSSGFNASCISNLVSASLSNGNRKASWGRGYCYDSTTANTGIKIQFQSGDITTGTFSLYGISS
jgi:hypothetical protein